MNLANWCKNGWQVSSAEAAELCAFTFELLADVLT